MPAEGHPPPKIRQRGPRSDPHPALRGQRRPGGPLGGDRAQASAPSRRGGAGAGRRGGGTPAKPCPEARCRARPSPSQRPGTAGPRLCCQWGAARPHSGTGLGGLRLPRQRGAHTFFPKWPSAAASWTRPPTPGGLPWEVQANGREAPGDINKSLARWSLTARCPSRFGRPRGAASHGSLPPHPGVEPGLSAAQPSPAPPHTAPSPRTSTASVCHQ